MMNEKTKNYDTFISYETMTGLSYAEHLKNALEKCGYFSFLADLSIDKGEDWKREINFALENCKYFIIVITSLTLKSERVIKEYEKAVKLEKRIIPCRWKKIKIIETKELSELQQTEFGDKCELANEVIYELNKVKETTIDNNPEEFLNRGNLFYNLGDLKKAIEFYEKALELAKAIGNKDGEGICHYNLGVVAYSEKGLYDQAMEEFKQAIRINPDCARAHCGLGWVYGKKGLDDQAIEELKEAIRIKPDYALAHNNLGWIYGMKGLYDQAIEEFKEAIKIKPNYAEAYYNIGVTYSTKELYDQAIGEYKEAIRINPDYAEAHYNLGAAYNEKGLYDQAIEEMKEAIRINPANAVAHYNLGCVYGKKGLYDQMIEQFKETIRINPDYTKAHYGLGVAYFFLNRREEALDEYKILKELDKELANKLFNLINK